MNASEFEFLRGFLKQRSGLDLAADKQYLVESRLMPIARRERMASLAQLIAALRGPGQEALKTRAVEAMTTNESFFFRDKTPFDQFIDTMLPSLMATRAAKKSVRIWCAAASTGQEPYSLAMAIKENAAKLGHWRFDIVGTDLSTEVLEKAKAGIYTQFEVQRGLPIQLLLKYFRQNGELWQIDPGLRAMIQFRPFNLLEGYGALGAFDIVFCRNVLIYFDQATKTGVLERMAKQLAPDGYLVLGSAETVVGLTQAFQPVAGKRGLYQRAAAQTAAVTPFPLRAAAG